MAFREMKYIRDHYVFGAAYRTEADWFLFAYVRRDSEHGPLILSTLRASASADRSDLSSLYLADPRKIRVRR
jgi:hypothetical protein